MGHRQLSSEAGLPGLRGGDKPGPATAPGAAAAEQLRTQCRARGVHPAVVVGVLELRSILLDCVGGAEKNGQATLPPCEQRILGLGVTALFCLLGFEPTQSGPGLSDPSPHSCWLTIVALLESILAVYIYDA